MNFPTSLQLSLKSVLFATRDLCFEKGRAHEEMFRALRNVHFSMDGQHLAQNIVTARVYAEGLV